VPHTVSELLIFADNDMPGLQAARRLRGRYQNELERVTIMCPDEPGADWADVARERSKQ
jgi:phage/plasmid primase-like uncharacterized protein